MKVLAEPLSPPASDLAAIREVTATIRPEDPGLADWFNGYAASHAARIAHDLAMVRRVARPGAVVLDIATVPLLLMAALHRQGVRVEGLDIEPDRFGPTIATLGLVVHRCDIEREALPYPDGSVDVVVFNEVFEHLRIDPIHTLGEIHRILAPSGLLLLSTPNGVSLIHLLRLLRERRLGPSVYAEYEKLRRLGHMGHVREYAMPEVAEFLERIGFTIEEVVWRGSYESRSLDGMCRLLPGLRPYFSIVARRGSGAPSLSGGPS